MAYTAFGYQKIRDMIKANVTYISIQDNSATPVELARIATNDSRVVVTENNSSPFGVVYQVTVHASDTGFGVGKTIGNYGLYDAATAGNNYDSGAFATTVTFQNTGDVATLTINVNTPA